MLSLSNIGNFANLDNDPCDIVDFNDISIFIHNWLEEGIPATGDINRDALVPYFPYKSSAFDTDLIV